MRQYDEIERQIDAGMKLVTDSDIAKFWADTEGEQTTLNEYGFSTPDMMADSDDEDFEEPDFIAVPVQHTPLNGWQALPLQERVNRLCEFYHNRASEDETSFFDQF